MIQRNVKFPNVPNMDKELDSIASQANNDISTVNNGLTQTNTNLNNAIKSSTSQSAATNSGLYLSATSGGSPTRQLKVKTVTLSDGTTLNVLVTD
jgi:hypothetical protein